MANNDNQIDLGKIYGIGQCGEAGCGVSNTVLPGSPRPSLEQIASYMGRNNPSLEAGGERGEVDFPSSSPIEGDISQMYQPITRQAAQQYPTPAVVMAENQGSGGNVMDSNLSGANAITDFSNPYPVTRESIQYLNGFIRTQIGRRVTIDFLIGSNTIESKSGYLLAVAANYILLNELDTNDVTACDFYNIKFIRFYY